MEIQSTIQPSAYEQTIISIVRTLPVERVLQIVEFTRFHEWQETNSAQSRETGDEKWERLFGTPESERLLAELAREALSDYSAGHTTEITISKNGLLIPA